MRESILLSIIIVLFTSCSSEDLYTIKIKDVKKVEENISIVESYLQKIPRAPHYDRVDTPPMYSIRDSNISSHLLSTIYYNLFP